jgi:hypothetical protein
MKYTVVPIGRSSTPRAEGLREAPAREIRPGRVDLESNDHAAAAEIADLRVRGERRGDRVPACRLEAVGGDHAVVAEDVEHGERGAARERVARVGVRVQEAARDIVVVERAVDRVGGQHAGERQEAAGDPLRQQHQVGHDARLLAREHRPGAAEAGHDLVGDQVDVVARAELARALEVRRVVHDHARRALHERLDDQRRDALVVRREVGRERVAGLARDVRGRAAVVRAPRVGGGHRVADAHDRRVGVAEDRDVGDGERAERLAVVAAGEADEAPLLRPPGVAPRVVAHLERDLGRRRAVGSVERVAEAARRERREPLGQLDRRTVRRAREHRVLELAELRDDRRADARLAMAEQVDPPRRHRVEQAAAVEVLEPHAVGARDRHERQRLVRLHLRARVPHRREAAPQPLVVARTHRIRPARAWASAARPRRPARERCRARAPSGRRRARSRARRTATRARAPAR